MTPIVLMIVIMLAGYFGYLIGYQSSECDNNKPINQETYENPQRTIVTRIIRCRL